MNIYPRPSGDGMAPVAKAVTEVRRQTRILQRPDGTRLAQLYAQVQAALANITSSVATAFAALVAGGFSTPGSIVDGGTIVANNLETTQGPTTNITAARVASWLQNSNGLIGTATSSRRFKTNEVLAIIDPRAVLSIDIKLWQYNAEIAKRDDSSSPDYVGPDYHVAENFGPIAEDLHAAGLWMCVVYERNDDQSLKLDENGEPIPFSIHDSLWGYVVHTALQWEVSRVDDIEERLTKAGI